MFTGIITAVGSLGSLVEGKLRVAVSPSAWDDPIRQGESVAVNGCCLTVVGQGDGILEFDLSEETLRKTALGSLALGAVVNLERAVRPLDRMGGHFVQGHVDGVGKLVSRRLVENGEVFRFEAPQGGSGYLAPKGSIAIDGISLTIVDPTESEFDVWVIPHTLVATNMATLKPGSKVNVEYDMLVKYLERLKSGD